MSEEIKDGAAVGSTELLGLRKRNPIILVDYLGDNEVYLVGLIGLISTLDEIEKQMNDVEYNYFDKGCGEYVFKCTYNEEQRGDYGRIELPSYWDLDEVMFKPHDIPNAQVQPDKTRK